ncbi:MAG: hypothetical protein LIO63_07360 [Akkermansia sp.]|nr:hypothetical protein [Akkermansia sp.]
MSIAGQIAASDLQIAAIDETLVENNSVIHLDFLRGASAHVIAGAHVDIAPEFIAAVNSERPLCGNVSSRVPPCRAVFRASGLPSVS